MSDHDDELMRLNQRFENVKNNPNWNWDMMRILIAAQQEVAELCNQQGMEMPNERPS